MKFENVLTFLFSGIICVSFCFRENEVANQIRSAKEKNNITLKRAFNSEVEKTDPNVIFEITIQESLKY